MTEYWEDTLSEILGNHNVKVTNEQLKRVASDVAIASSVEIEYTGVETSSAEAKLLNENNKLQQELEYLESFLGTSKCCNADIVYSKGDYMGQHYKVCSSCRKYV